MNSKKTILLVDDTKELNDAAAITLTAAGYSVVQAFNGYECLKLLKSVIPDLILLDVVMPGMDGIEVCRKIKSSAKGSGIYVLMLSGLKTGSDHQSEGLESGADGYIARPIKNREMLARVEAALRIVEIQRNLNKALQTSRKQVRERKKAEAKVKEINTHLEELVIKRTSQFEAARRDLEAFSYSVAHNLRAPLRAVSSFSEILISEQSDILNEEARRILGIINDSGRQMSRLIDGLITYTAIGRTELSIEKIDLMKMIAGISKRMKSEFKDRSISFRVNDLPEVAGDRKLISLVWENLISNAIRFSSDKNESVIEIGYLDSGREMQFYISDNGEGFNPAYADKIFGAFEKLNNKRDLESSGISLAITKRIVQRHNGQIWAESKPGTGSRFIFTLPFPYQDKTG